MLDSPKTIIISLLVLWNIWAFALIGLDKHKAKTKRWRIPERHLLFMAFAMGGAGILGGMLFFHHKTRHLKFVIGVPLMLAFNIIFFLAGRQGLSNFWHLR